MNPQTKVTFSLSIGLNGCNRKEVFTLEDLGYDPKFDTEIDKFLNDAYEEWMLNNCDSGWSIEEGESE